MESRGELVIDILIIAWFIAIGYFLSKKTLFPSRVLVSLVSVGHGSLEGCDGVWQSPPIRNTKLMESRSLRSSHFSKSVIPLVVKAVITALCGESNRLYCVPVASKEPKTSCVMCTSASEIVLWSLLDTKRSVSRQGLVASWRQLKPTRKICPARVLSCVASRVWDANSQGSGYPATVEAAGLWHLVNRWRCMSTFTKKRVPRQRVVSGRVSPGSLHLDNHNWSHGQLMMCWKG